MLKLYSRASRLLQSTFFLTIQLSLFRQFDHPSQGPAVIVTHLNLNPFPQDIPALRLPLTTTRGLGLPSPPHAGSTELTQTNPRSAPGRKTNWLGGRNVFLMEAKPRSALGLVEILTGWVEEMFFLTAGTSSSFLYTSRTLSLTENS